MGGKIILNGKEYASSTPGGGASSFADLDDVDLTFLQDGEFPQYNSLTQKWENVTLTKVNDVKVNGTSVVNSNLVANIKSYKEITQAEYELLPSTKLTDGIAYFITDAVEAEGYPPLIYSDVEREVGVWRDGKPLYQKSYAKTLPSAHDHDNGNSFLIDSDVSYIDKLVDSNGFIYDSGGTCSALNGGISNLAGWSYGIHKNVNNELVLYGATQTTYIGGGMILLTIQYTKTTDTPGQGIWAGNGAMAHHYSTEEVIVGTWIDGKPIYERVITKTCNFTTSTEANSIYEGRIDLSSEIPNIDMAWLDFNMSWYYAATSASRGFYAGWYEKDTGAFYVRVLYSRSNVPCTLVIRYTKTTD